MLKWLGALMVVVGVGSSVGHLNAEHRQPPFAVVMTNDADANQIRVYDVHSQALLQTLSTFGRGGVGGNVVDTPIHNGAQVASRRRFT
jgi:hypothetical protein